MTSTSQRRTLRSALGLIALALAAMAFAAASNAAGAADSPAGAKHTTERLVVRGESTVVDAQCDSGLCIELTDASFRGTPVGTGAYNGRMQLHVADAFPNGEDGVCAPLDGEIVLGVGSPNRLTLAVTGDSCQDGGGNPTTTAFTGLARFTVKRGTGIYAKARGHGLATFAEDAADRDRMTLIGQIRR
jgi:hypothetical protein